MQKLAGTIRYSPTDLTTFLDSEFASWMDRWYLDNKTLGARLATGVVCDSVLAELPDPFAVGLIGSCCPDDKDEQLEMIARKGDEHEEAFLQQLKRQGYAVAEITRDDNAHAATIGFMRDGVAIIYQANLQSDGWGGYADFLAKCDGESTLGDHHYEVWDTKLAKSTKPYFLVQLCAYAEMLEQIQGRRPAEVEVILGTGERRRYPTNNFYYYYRELKRAFTRFHASFDPQALPDPGLSRSYGRWNSYAQQILAAADHMSFVAGITRSQIKKLNDAGITTMTGLSMSKDRHVPGLSEALLDRLRTQASLQIASRGKERPEFKVITPSVEDPRRGLALLPPSSEADVFFDMEGYPLVDGGLEYLFGAVHLDDAGSSQFRDWWAHNAIEEKVGFERFIDWVYDRWSQDPSMHIYHYAAYEVTAVRRLMGKYATREAKVDTLLRNRVFVDLYPVTRQGLIVGAQSYSLKDVERLYLDKRAGDVTTAGGSIVAYQHWLDDRDGDTWERSKMLREIRDYNRVDCESLLHLYRWLWERRVEAGLTGTPEAAAELELATTESEVKPERPSTTLANNLLTPIESGQVADAEQSRVQELLAWLLEFHWREAKPVFWKMFARHEMTELELIDDIDCLGGMVRSAKPRLQVKKSWEYEYCFDPDQDTKLHAGSKCIFAHDLQSKCELTSFDLEAGLLTIKLGPTKPEPPSRLSLIPDEYVPADTIADAVYQYVERWSRGEDVPRAIDDLLHRRSPRIQGRANGTILPAGTTLQSIVDVAVRLDESTLCIQGPPGTGKTFTAAAVIVELITRGKRVGITATSHKAILNAMHAVARSADEQKKQPRLLKVGGDPKDPLIASGRIKVLKPEDVANCLNIGGVVVGGTAWVFSRPELAGQFDYLVVDEAGQFSLANVVATGQAATNLILVGDQMQLAQPIQGSHPGESGKSGLEYLLQGKATVPPDLGIFLDMTWRMHPHICEFISDAVYEGRLKSHPNASKQEVRCPTTHGEFRRTCGVVFVEVDHQFNSQCSDEEVDEIEKLVGQLIGRCVIGRDGEKHNLALSDILVVAPYNMQVRRLKARLGQDARVGSVDRFQGQEAAVVIVSMCASSVEECPRGIEFVLNKNRLNVAVSRAKCLAIVVGCRGMMATRCRTVEHMEMTNLYCRLAAHAEQPPSVITTKP